MHVARLGERIKRNGEVVPQLEQRRLVAVLGSIDILRPRLWLEALRQGVLEALEAKQVGWVSDGEGGSGISLLLVLPLCYRNLRFLLCCPKYLESCLGLA